MRVLTQSEIDSLLSSLLRDSSVLPEQAQNIPSQNSNAAITEPQVAV